MSHTIKPPKPTVLGETQRPAGGQGAPGRALQRDRGQARQQQQPQPQQSKQVRSTMGIYVFENFSRSCLCVHVTRTRPSHHTHSASEVTKGDSSNNAEANAGTLDTQETSNDDGPAPALGVAGKKGSSSGGSGKLGVSHSSGGGGGHEAASGGILRHHHHGMCSRFGVCRPTSVRPSIHPELHIAQSPPHLPNRADLRRQRRGGREAQQRVRLFALGGLCLRQGLPAPLRLALPLPRHVPGV